MKRLSIKPWKILLLMPLFAMAGHAEDLPDSAAAPRQIAAYSVQDPLQLLGYFPAAAPLKILTGEGDYLNVEYTSPSGVITKARVRRLDMGFPAHVDRSQLPVRSLGDRSPWVEKADGEFDDTFLSARARTALSQEGFKWRHAETRHFVIHFEHGIFAQKVARMAEFYYDYISIDLDGPEDRLKGRSHILIYRSSKRWKKFMTYAGPQEMLWAFAFVSGPEMYLQQADDTRASAGVLAHEMTHLIMNRFFERQPPSWLNEGLAEWYGEFAYSSYKGTKKSRRAVFQPIRKIIPLDILLRMESYPQDPEMISLFYQTSKYLTGYLRMRHPEETFQPFMAGILEGGEAWPLIQSLYGYDDIETLTQKFKTFAHFK